MKEKNSFFSKKLRKILVEYRMSQTDLECTTGIAQTVISRWCRGETVPTLASIEKLSKAFNVPINYFLEDTDSDILHGCSGDNINEKFLNFQEEIMRQLAGNHNQNLLRNHQQFRHQNNIFPCRCRRR